MFSVESSMLINTTKFFLKKMYIYIFFSSCRHQWHQFTISQGIVNPDNVIKFYSLDVTVPHIFFHSWPYTCSKKLEKNQPTRTNNTTSVCVVVRPNHLIITQQIRKLQTTVKRIKYFSRTFKYFTQLFLALQSSKSSKL